MDKINDNIVDMDCHFKTEINMLYFFLTWLFASNSVALDGNPEPDIFLLIYANK
jgi:hypothetical protein